MIPEHLASIIHNLPQVPGIYQYIDKQGIVIYVGKAKNLKKRVSSYFVKEAESAKTRLLIKNIFNIKYIITNTETDALLLENSLIKKYKPKYNINLKDDKSYPWIVITNEPFPRVFYNRRKLFKNAEYFGPYTNIKQVDTLLELIKNIYPIRSCKLDLSPTAIAQNKFKVCLEYYIKNCKGPCQGYQTEADYNLYIQHIRHILRGNLADVIKQLKTEMFNYAQNYQFEKAQELKEKIEILQNYQSKSTVVSPTLGNLDVFSYKRDHSEAYVNYFMVINGAIIQSNTLEYVIKLNETDAEILSTAITEFRNRYQSNAPEIVVPFLPDVMFNQVQYVVPKRGDKRKLLDLSMRNLDYYLHEKYKNLALLNPEQNTKRLMQQMMKDLRLKEEPRHIECFDNSNIQGAYAVAAMSVFKDGKPSKKDYRHYTIKTIQGPNDFASMEEIIYRRYKRVVEEQLPLPQLIVIDGGKGQLSAAVKSLKKLNLIGKIAVIGIAKKLEEIYFPGDSVPLYIDKKSETLRIIQQIRNEAHRFGITHHRNKRSKEIIKTELSNIKGISDKTIQKLLSHFKSVQTIKQQSLDSIATIIGPSKAKLVFNYFNVPKKLIG
jgi:excinuclease ABC subunit C